MSWFEPRVEWCLVSLVVIGIAGCPGQEAQQTEMSRPARSISDETVRFHQIVEHGDLEELKSALAKVTDVNVPGHVGKTALMIAIGNKDLEKTKLLVLHGADPELTDDFNHTTLGCAVDFDFEEGVRYLLSLGVDRGYAPKYPLKKVAYESLSLDMPMPEDLKQVMSEEEWKASLGETFREAGQDQSVRPLISDVQSVGVLKLFLQAGDDLTLAPTDVKRTYVGLENGGSLRTTRSTYRTQKQPRYGGSNPERMDLAFWNEMIRTGVNAYVARELFDDDPFRSPGAVWCYDRFGSTITQLDDGRFVQIGGEHEDFYDPDFFIYNDVVVHDGKGNFELYGYPREVFPPTDFHTATLCEEFIYIIGCLGYPEQRREGRTPIYRLKLDTWEIEAVEPTGEPPGWIYNHRARYEPESNSIRITSGEIQIADGEDWKILPNQEQFELDLSLLQWRRLD